MADFFDTIKLDDFFDFKDKEVSEALKNGGFTNYFREDSVKSIFAIYLMGKKDMNLFEIIEPGQAETKVKSYQVRGAVDNEVFLNSGMHTEQSGLDQLTADQKKELGKAFINDIKRHRIYGEVIGGKEQVEANVKWYGEMFSKAVGAIEAESETFPTLDDFTTADEVAKLADSTFTATGEIAEHFLLETGVNFSRSSNRSTKQNNYGVDINKVFIEGYGGADKLNKDTNRMKSIAVVSTYTKRVANAVKSGDTKEAVASLAAGQMACKYRDDIATPANADEMTEDQIKDETKFLKAIDKDPLGADKMEVAAQVTYVNYKILLNKENYSGNNIDKFKPFLTGDKLDETEDDLTDNITGLTINTTMNEITNKNVGVVNSIIGTINMNNNSDIYNFHDYEGPVEANEGNSLFKPSISLKGLDEETLKEEEKVFDATFSSLINSEKIYMDKAGHKNLFNNFKIEGKPISEYTKKLNNVSEEMRVLYGKHVILAAMASKELKLTYSPYKLSDDNWKNVEISNKNIEIKRPANIAKVPYNELNAFRTNISGVIESYEELKRIKSIFHIDRQLYKNVTTSLQTLKTMCENIYEKNALGETVVAESTWKNIIKQFDEISGHMNTYIEARRGAKSDLGKARLKKITSLFGNINAIKDKMNNFVKQSNRTQEFLYGDNKPATDEIINYDWDRIESHNADKEYVTNYEEAGYYIYERTASENKLQDEAQEKALKEKLKPKKVDNKKKANEIKDPKKDVKAPKKADKEPNKDADKPKATNAQDTRAKMLAKLKKGKKNNMIKK